MIREFQQSDMRQLREIHAKFYKNEFSLDEFNNKFLCAFTVTDDNGTIITAGGPRSILEQVIITNKDIPVKERRMALYEMLSASVMVADRAGYSQIHAFIQDDRWLGHLKRVGFKQTKGQSIYLGF